MYKSNSKRRQVDKSTVLSAETTTAEQREKEWTKRMRFTYGFTIDEMNEFLEVTDSDLFKKYCKDHGIIPFRFG